jgi:CDP-2,3-bis-(O-geranylgeranyl)-sn-glycerol synthase
LLIERFHGIVYWLDPTRLERKSSAQKGTPMVPAIALIGTIAGAWSWDRLRRFIREVGFRVGPNDWALGLVVVSAVAQLRPRTLMLVAVIAIANMAVPPAASMSKLLRLRWLFEKSRVDFGRNWRDGRPIFGETKSWAGLAVAALAGMGALAAVQSICSSMNYTSANPATARLLNAPLLMGAAFGLLPLMVDLAKSFYKRRRNARTGERHWADLLDSPLAVVLAGLLGVNLGATQLALILPLLIVAHPLVGTIGVALRLKREV